GVAEEPHVPAARRQLDQGAGLELERPHHEVDERQERRRPDQYGRDDDVPGQAWCPRAQREVRGDAQSRPTSRSSSRVPSRSSIAPRSTSGAARTASSLLTREGCGWTVVVIGYSWLSFVKNSCASSESRKAMKRCISSWSRELARTPMPVTFARLPMSPSAKNVWATGKSGSSSRRRSR